MSLKLNTASGGSITLQEADTASNLTLTVPAQAGTVAIKETPAFSAYLTLSQSVANNTVTKITINTEEFDTNSNYDTSNYRFTPTVAGYYQVNGLVTFTTLSSGYYGIVRLFKNGSEVKYGVNTPSATNAYTRSNISVLVYLNGSTDYIELYCYQNSGSSNPLATGSVDSYFQASMVRAA
jgi:hypothetical protein